MGLALALSLVAAAGPALAADDPGMIFCRSLDGYLAKAAREGRPASLTVRYTDSWIACGYEKRFRSLAKPICNVLTGWGFEYPTLFPVNVRDCLVARGGRVTKDETGEFGTAGYRINRLEGQVPDFGTVIIVFESDPDAGYGGHFGKYVMRMTPTRSSAKR